MRFDNLKRGMYVIPISKNVGNYGFSDFKERCPDYKKGLFVNDPYFMSNSGIYCVEVKGPNGRDYLFLPSDLIPFRESAFESEE